MKWLTGNAQRSIYSFIDLLNKYLLSALIIHKIYEDSGILSLSQAHGTFQNPCLKQALVLCILFLFYNNVFYFLEAEVARIQVITQENLLTLRSMEQ